MSNRGGVVSSRLRDLRIAFPSSLRRGGRSLNRMLRSNISSCGRGGHNPHGLAVFDHPGCDAEERKSFVPVAATPPQEEGNAEAAARRSLFWTAVPLEEGNTMVAEPMF